MLTNTPQLLAQELEQIYAKLLHLATGESLKTSEISVNLSESALTTQHLDTLCEKFSLLESERQALLLCLAFEMISGIGQLYAHIEGNAQRTRLTLAIVQRFSPDYDLRLLTTQSALQQWQLIQFDPGLSHSHSPMRIDPAILSYVLGYPYADPFLKPYLTLVPASETSPALPPSQQTIAADILCTWGLPRLYPVQLTHSDTRTRTDIALCASTQWQHQLYKTSFLSVPTQLDLLYDFIQRWQRHTRFTPSVLLLECDDLDTNNPTTQAQLSQFIERLQSPIILSTEARLPLSDIFFVYEASL